MRKRTWSLQDAKNRFSAVVEAAQRYPQTVTKHGKPTVVVVDAAEFERLKRLESLEAPTFTEHLLAMPKRAEGDYQRLAGELRDVDF